MTEDSDDVPYRLCRLCDRPIDEFEDGPIQHLLDEYTAKIFFSSETLDTHFSFFCRHSLTANASNVFQHFYQDIDMTMSVPPFAVRI